MKVIDVEFNFVENVGTMEEEAEKYKDTNPTNFNLNQKY